MTRINAGIDPTTLIDSHLFAEWRELPRILTLSTTVGTKQKIPNSFTLNKGHMLFFYNKLHYLAKRFDLICDELETRPINFKRETSLSIKKAFLEAKETHPHLWNDWCDENAFEILKERLHERFGKMTLQKLTYKGQRLTINECQMLLVA